MTELWSLRQLLAVLEDETADAPKRLAALRNLVAALNKEAARIARAAAIEANSQRHESGREPERG